MTQKKLQIRNSTAEFLIFTSQAAHTIEVTLPDETIRLTQKKTAALFEAEAGPIHYHFKEILSTRLT